MRVDEIKLANFRCFESQTFDLASRFNLLVGDNGLGKTSILDGLAVGLGSLFLGIPHPAKQRGIHRDDVRVQFFRQGETTTVERQFPSEVTCRGEVFGHAGEWTRELTDIDGKTTRRKARWISQKAKVVQKRVQQGNSDVMPVVSYYGTGRLWVQIRNRKVTTAGPRSRFMGYLDCLNPASDEKRLIEWFKTQEMAAIQHRQQNQTLEACRHAIISCVPNATRAWFDIREDQLMLEASGQVLPFHYLSDGYRNALAMVADIAVRAATLNPALGPETREKTPGVVLIDEIDLHLHPKWQRRVVSDLMRTFPMIQFVATTHSPFVIQSLPVSDVVRLLNLDDEERDDYGDQSVEDISEGVQGVELPQRSQRFLDMMRAAERYYAALRDVEQAPPEQVEELRRQLEELSLPFSDDPAYQAFLRSQRVAAGIGEENS